MIITREIIKDDLVIIEELQHSKECSFCLLQSSFAYSLTERIIQMETQKTLDREFSICLNTSLVAFIRIKPKDPISQSTEIQLHCSNTGVDISNELKKILSHIKNYENVTRFYCFLFPHELEEQNILTSLGFTQEAVYDQHIYSQGQYLDLLVFGTERLINHDL
jgi:hypothetical protein